MHTASLTPRRCVVVGVALLAAVLGGAAPRPVGAAQGGAAPAAVRVVRHVAQGGNLIVDGDFETPMITATVGYQTVGAGSVIGGGFTVTSGNVDVTVRSFRGGFPVHGGNQSLDLNGDGPGAITQAIPTTPGHQYQLTFFVSSNTGDPGHYSGPRMFNVLISGATLASYSVPASQTSFTMETQTFVATTTSTSVQFASTIPDNAGPVLDDIAVIDVGAVATPTPYPTQPPLPTYTPQAPYPTQPPLPTYTPIPSRPVAPTTPTLLYIAGGRDDASMRATLALLNTQARPMTARLTLYGADGVTRAATVTVNPDAQRLVPLAGLAPVAGPFGLRITASQQLAAQLIMTRLGHDADAVLGVPALSTRQYLAEGYTRLTFHETVSILNPDAARPARVALSLLPANGRIGRIGRTVAVVVAAHSHAVVDVNSLLTGQALSIVADSDRPVLVERTMTFGHDGHGSSYGLTMQTAAPTTATRWLFPEGTTANHFQTFITILNPGAGATRVTARFYSTVGTILGARSLTVAARSRATLLLSTILRASSVAGVVTSDRPVVVEQPEYFGSPNATGVAGSVVLGRTATNTRWSFPYGDTSRGQSEFVLLYNPSTLQTASVDVTVYSGGARVTKRFSVGPTARYTLDMGRAFPRMRGRHGVTLRSANGQGFVAEQTLFATDRGTLIGTESYYNSGA